MDPMALRAGKLFEVAVWVVYTVWLLREGRGRQAPGQKLPSNILVESCVRMHALPARCLQGLGEQKRTKYKINGTATTAIEKSNPNRPLPARSPDLTVLVVLRLLLGRTYR